MRRFAQDAYYSRKSALGWLNCDPGRAIQTTDKIYLDPITRTTQTTDKSNGSLFESLIRDTVPEGNQRGVNGGRIRDHPKAR